MPRLGVLGPYSIVPVLWELEALKTMMSVLSNLCTLWLLYNDTLYSLYDLPRMISHRSQATMIFPSKFFATDPALLSWFWFLKVVLHKGSLKLIDNINRLFEGELNFASKMIKFQERSVLHIDHCLYFSSNNSLSDSKKQCETSTRRGATVIRNLVLYGSWLSINCIIVAVVYF